MKLNSLSLLTALATQQVAGHATFQQLWVNSVDMGSQCARLPQSNNPVSVSSNDMRCNAGGQNAAKSKCPVKAGDTVTVEMHQHNSRACTEDAIGGAHYGPIMVYLSKVSDAATADGSSSFFKIYENSWAAASGSANGDGDYWGNKDMNKCCGRVDVKIPSDIAAGDYLLRAETIALHSAGSAGGAQFYLTCYQITVSGGGSNNPAGVKFPGAYSASDPGVMVDIHRKLTGYTAPGPAVIAGGTKKTPGGSCTGCEQSCSPGSNPGTTLPSAPQPTNGGGSGGGSGCTVAKFQQCGGQDYTGCTTCASGGSCVAVSPPYYSQCQ